MEESSSAVIPQETLDVSEIQNTVVEEGIVLCKQMWKEDGVERPACTHWEKISRTGSGLTELACMFVLCLLDSIWI